MVELVRADIERHIAGAQPISGPELRITEWTPPSVATPPTVTAPRPTSLRKKSAFRPLAWAAVLLAFAGLAAFFLISRRQTADVPIIASVQGEVRLVGPDGERGLMPGDSWRREEKLKMSGPNSAAKLRFLDGSQLDFGGNTVAVNESSKDGIRLRLDHGTMLAALKQQPALHPFVFVTPETEAIVVGTRLRLVVSGHSTRLEVTEGEVRFRRRHDGAEVEVKAGYYAVVAPNAPLVATPFHPDSHAVP
jgi:ferric-dicitrate binding protein FerR (iron transport regulator)